MDWLGKIFKKEGERLGNYIYMKAYTSRCLNSKFSPAGDIDFFKMVKDNKEKSCKCNEIVNRYLWFKS